MTKEIARASDAAGNEPDASGMELSQKVGEMEIAQKKQGKATNDSAPQGDKAPPQSDATPTNKAGPLADLVTGDSAGLIKYMPDVAEADKKWMEPYKRLTDTGGHELVDKFDGAMTRAQMVLSTMTDAEYNEIGPIVNRYVDPRKQIYPQHEAAMQKYPELLKACQDLRAMNGDQKTVAALDTRDEVRTNMTESIRLREKYAQDITNSYAPNRQLKNGMSLTGGALVLIIESKELARYQGNR